MTEVLHLGHVPTDFPSDMLKTST